MSPQASSGVGMGSSARPGGWPQCDPLPVDVRIRTDGPPNQTSWGSSLSERRHPPVAQRAPGCEPKAMSGHFPGAVGLFSLPPLGDTNRGGVTGRARSLEEAADSSPGRQPWEPSHLRPGLLSDVPSGLKTSALGRARPVTPKSRSACSYRH